jgi:hypothetical protein
MGDPAGRFDETAVGLVSCVIDFMATCCASCAAIGMEFKAYEHDIFLYAMGFSVKPACTTKSLMSWALIVHSSSSRYFLRGIYAHQSLRPNQSSTAERDVPRVTSHVTSKARPAVPVITRLSCL